MVGPPPQRDLRAPGPPGLKYLTILILLTLYWVMTGFDVLYSTGYTGTTKKTDGSGCVCHGPHVPTPDVRVWVEGPASVLPSSTNSYRLLMTGGPAVKGGFNLAAGHGSLAVTDGMTQLLFGEMTHTGPRPFVNDTVEWTFDYIAPPVSGLDTLFSVGNSVDATGNPTGDEFNFGEPFTVEVAGDTVTAVGDSPAPLVFRLLRNYPNPFNPSTTIRYSIGKSGDMELEVYDITGSRMAVLFDGHRGPGSYEAVWDASARPAGIYFSRLTVAGKSRTLKMMLIR